MSSQGQRRHLMQLFEVEALSATNLPNVRRLSKAKTRALVVLEGPLAEPYRTEEDELGGLDPTWETPFTVALHSCEQLRLTVFIKRTARRNKPIATTLVSLKDFAGSSGGSHEYSLVPCGVRAEIESVQPAKLRISARLLGNRQAQRQRPPLSPATAAMEYSGSIEYPGITLSPSRGHVIYHDSEEDSE